MRNTIKNPRVYRAAKAKAKEADVLRGREEAFRAFVRTCRELKEIVDTFPKGSSKADTLRQLDHVLLIGGLAALGSPSAFDLPNLQGGDRG